MSVSGTWQPTQRFNVTIELLTRYVELAQELNLEALATDMPAAKQTEGVNFMKLQAEDWQPAESLNDSDLELLIRFFTLAEMQLSGWDAGKTSPVIYLARILKSRGNFSKELKQWVKGNTDNRFLPNGAVVM